MRKYIDRNRTTNLRTWVTPTKERHRQNGGVASEVIDRDLNDKVLLRGYRARWECPLDIYKHYGLITETEHKAGIRFRKAYFNSVLSRSAAAERVNPRPTSLGLTVSEKIVKEAYETLPSYNKGIITDICGHSEITWNPRALDALKRGLGHLVLLWNMVAIEVCDHKREK